ncbi:kinesin motor domain-containing protein, putative [Eimeria praecox]|uniref:Kinesin motor domain-containing protein, putative n=1 Tax=Eimeria praecox TaxID=51316 RepID=U6H4K6_9EIME|nr:kinesin motor domain-containing protein, putative [Eimeria praecox]
MLELPSKGKGVHSQQISPLYVVSRCSCQPKQQQQQQALQQPSHLEGPLYSVVSGNSISVALPESAKKQTSAAPDSCASSSSSFRVSGKVFDANVGNTALYVNTLQPLVLSSTEGISSLVIAYGTSGSGKSHSLFGSLHSPGLIFSALSDLFSHIASYNNSASASAKSIPSCVAKAAWTEVPCGAPRECPSKGSNDSPPGLLSAGAPSGGPPRGSCGCPCGELGVLGSEFSVSISFVEIRNEDVGDLLRGCERQYRPGQRLPTVCTTDLETDGGNSDENTSLKQVDVGTLEEAVELVARAAAFKKARDSVLGNEGTNCILRLSVERACCLACPQHAPAAAMAAAGARSAEAAGGGRAAAVCGKATGALQAANKRQTEKSAPKETVTILKADITFFEAARVETLLNQPPGLSVLLVFVCIRGTAAVAPAAATPASASVLAAAVAARAARLAPLVCTATSLESAAAASARTAAASGPAAAEAEAAGRDTAGVGCALVLRLVDIEGAVNRSLFYLTECLLRLSESPASLKSFAWGASAATSLLRSGLEGPCFLLMLATISPCPEAVVPSLAVLRLARTVSDIRRRIQRRFLQPSKSRLFSLHRSVLRESEALFLGVSSLRRQQQLLRLQRQKEWWLPSTEERLRAILVGGEGDWRLLEGSRVGHLRRMLEHLQSSSSFMRFVLAEEEPFQEKVLPVGPPTAPTTPKAKPTPQGIPPLSLKTKAKLTQFTPIAEVPIQLNKAATPAPAPTNDERINLTALLFGSDTEEESPHRGAELAYPRQGHPYPGEVPLYPDKGDPYRWAGPDDAQQGPPYPMESFRSPAVRGLFSDEKQEGASPGPPTPQANEAEGPPSAIGRGPDHGTPQTEEPHGNLQREAVMCPDPPPSELFSYPSKGPLALSPRTPAATETTTAKAAAEAEVAAECSGDGPRGPELGMALGVGTPGDILNDATGPQTLVVAPPRPLGVSEPFAVDPSIASSPGTPLSSESEEDTERDADRHRKRLFFKVQLRLTAAPPLSESIPQQQQQQHQQPVAFHCSEEVDHENRQYNTNLLTPRFSTKRDGNGDEPDEAVCKGLPPKAVPLRNSSNSASEGGNESSKGRRQEMRSEEGRNKLLREASALRSEVMSLIQESPTAKPWGGPRFCRSPVVSSPLCSNNNEPEGAPRMPSRDRSSREGYFEGGPNPKARPPPQLEHRQVPQTQDRNPPEGPRCVPCEGGAACNLYCVHAHVPLSPVNAASPSWGTSDHQGVPQPQRAYLQLVEMPCGNPPSPWGPQVTTCGFGREGMFKGRPMTCVPPAALEQPQIAQAIQARDSSRRPPRAPPLTEADRELLHFRASKGGASWEVPASPARAAARNTTAHARAAAAGEGEGSGFCLPEEPRGRCRPADSKSDLLLQGSLRPWTRKGRSPPCVSVSPAYSRGRITTEGPAVRHTRTRGRQSGGPSAQGKGLQRGMREACPSPAVDIPQPANSCRAVHTPQAAHTPTHIPVTNAVYAPALSTFPGQVRAPIIVPSTASVAGGASRPRGYELQFKGHATLFGCSCDGSSSSGDPPSSVSSSLPTARGEMEGETQKDIPRSSEQRMTATAAAAATDKDLKSSGVRGASLQNPVTVSPNIPQHSQHEEQHMQQRLPQQQELERHKQQQQEQHHHQHKQQLHLQQESIGSRAQDDMTSTVLRLPSSVGGSPLPQAASGRSEFLPRPAAAAIPFTGAHAAASSSACLPEGAPGSQGSPNYPQAGNLSARGAAGEVRCLHRGVAAVGGHPYFQESPQGHSNPAAHPTKPHVRVLHSPVPTSCNSEGPVGASLSSPCYHPVSWGNASFSGPSGVKRAYSPSMTCWAPMAPQSSSPPARIVNIIKRTREGIATDFVLGKEKSRTVYPPEQPLNIPLASTGSLGGIPQASSPRLVTGAYQPCARGFRGSDAAVLSVPAEAAVPAANGAANPYSGPSPMSTWGLPPTLAPGQVWAKTTFFPGSSQGEGAPQATLCPQGPSAYYACTPTPSAWGHKGFPVQQGTGAQGGPSPCGQQGASQQAASRAAPTSGSSGCLRTCSVGPRQGVVRRPTEVRSSSSGAAPAAGREQLSRGNLLTMMGEESIQEGGEANCFDDCLALLNAKVGRFYRSRPEFPPGQTLAGRPPCPFRRRRSVSRAVNRGAVDSTSSNPPGKGEGSCDAPRSCELKVSCGVGK